VDPHGGAEGHDLPRPTLWPVAFAIGIVCILAGLVISWPAVAVGALIAVVAGFLWVRDVTRGERQLAVEDSGPEGPPARPAPALPADQGPPAMPEPDSEEEIERYPRNVFLELSTLGLGAAIGGIVTLPALGFAVLPAFINQGHDEVDIGPLGNFAEGQWQIATFLTKPEAGEVSRRTAYVRNNGLLDGKPSFTILSNRCVHLGCPVQPQGPTDDEKKKTVQNEEGAPVDIIPTQPSGFGCPCHGGAYDSEGNRTAGPPVRALDRYDFAIRNGRLFLGNTYSVSEVASTGKDARIKRYKLATPGQHVDGLESWLYPVQPPR
jgi:Rieske Fe-S protein